MKTDMCVCVCVCMHIHVCVHPCVCAPVCVQFTTVLFPVPDAKERTLHHHLWALGPWQFYLDEATPYRAPWTEVPGRL